MKQSTYYKILRNIEENQYEQIRAGKIPSQSKGWVQHLRLGFGMSLRQLGNKLGITATSAKELEQREIQGTITLQKLQQAASAFDMSLFYMFVPNSYHGSENPLEEIVRNKSLEVARQIIGRASSTMILEDQETDQKEIDEEIQSLAKKIEQEMPRYLWD